MPRKVDEQRSETSTHTADHLPPSASVSHRVSLMEAFRFWLKLGFISFGAPYIEVLRGNRRLTGALSGITAAVVGVVLNLALVFGAAVIWPHGLMNGDELVRAPRERRGFHCALRVQGGRAVGGYRGRSCRPAANAVVLR